MFNRAVWFCFFILIGFHSFGQALNLQWTQPVSSVDAKGKVISALHFSGASYDSLSLPYYADYVSGNVSSSILAQIVTKPLSASELAIVSTYSFPSAPVVSIQYRVLRGVNQSIIKFIPIITGTNGQLLKIVSFVLDNEFSSQPSSNSNARITLVNNSVLGTGYWVKIAVLKSGIHKIDYSFLKNAGFPVNTLDPRTLRLYGNGGGMLPQSNSAFREQDVVENPIWVNGENDGILHSQDYLLFHAKGQDYVKADSNMDYLTHVNNLYSDSAFYFLTYNQGPGLRIQVSDEYPEGSIITTTDACVFHENDLYNIGHTGRLWLGEKFDLQTRFNFAFNTPDIEPASSLRVDVICASKMKIHYNQYVTFSTSLANYQTTFNNVLIYGRGSGANDPVGGIGSQTYFINNSDEISQNSNLDFSISFLKNGITTAIGYLDKINVSYKRRLNKISGQMYIINFSSALEDYATYKIANATSDLKVWDITDPIRPVQMPTKLNGSELSFNAASKILKQYIAFDVDFLNPVFLGKVANQNLHAESVPDFVIVTHADFISAANRLAAFRRTKNNLKVLVVTINQVNNEFASGAQDVSAIRDMARFFMKKGGINSNFKYMMLMGGASYDYKNRLPFNTNFVPVYESIESLDMLRSFSSDDYFGLLDDNEGEWSESSDNSMLDIGIGRVPASNLDQVNVMVDKFISYSTNTKSYNNWRNRLTFITDDDDSGLHSNQAETLIDYLNFSNPQLLTNKLFLDFYVQENTPVGQYSPDIERDIDNAVNQGSLIMNYTGHGREIALASENVITIPRIQSWTNKDNFTFFVTATCEFGRYDDPTLYSGAQALVLTPNAAAVGVLTTTRVVFAFSNLSINDAFYKSVFTKIDGKWPYMGDVMQKTKNLSQIGVNNRNFTMFGDPTLKLACPEDKIVLTKYNNQPVAAGKDTVSALQKVVFEGEIRDNNNILVNDFNGDLVIRYFDKQDTIYTRGDETPRFIQPFTVLKDFIYDGKVSVKQGKFSFTFVVPKDISYQYGYGKISLYASKDDFSLDATGNNDSIYLGGSTKNGQIDNSPPLVKLYMNDESFVFGGTTNSNAVMLVKLSDENGINVAGSGIGHEITAIMNEQSQKSIVLNQYYSTTKDDFTKGSISYNVKDLPVGNNTLRVKAWDVHNNSGEGYLEFVVANTSEVALNHVLNYPNPFSNNTSFHFDHNRAGDDLDVMIQVYTINGVLVKTLHANYFSANSHVGDISWNGKDDFGDKIGNGVYIYKVSIRSNRDGGQTYQYQKLVLLN